MREVLQTRVAVNPASAPGNDGARAGFILSANERPFLASIRWEGNGNADSTAWIGGAAHSAGVTFPSLRKARALMGRYWPRLRLGSSARCGPGGTVWRNLGSSPRRTCGSFANSPRVSQPGVGGTGRRFAQAAAAPLAICFRPDYCAIVQYRPHPRPAVALLNLNTRPMPVFPSCPTTAKTCRRRPWTL